jgi:hypothetical protein
VLADPVESDDDPVLAEEEDEEDDGVGVVVVPEDDVTVEDDAPLAVLDVPAWVCAARMASAATAAVPTTPKDVVSLPRKRSARSRSAAVMRRFGAGITESPGDGPSADATRRERVGSRGAGAARRADR